MTGNGKTALADALDICTAELEILIDRHFAAHRELVVEPEGSNWTAAVGDVVLFRSPDRQAVLRFARTFAHRTPGVAVTVMYEWGLPSGHSVKVPSADDVVGHARNVVPIR